MGQLDKKITGAFLLGFVIVASSYILSEFKNSPSKDTNLVATNEAPPRILIETTDSNADGIEDWQEEFISPQPVILNKNSGEDYEPPTTLTGQVGVAFLRSIITTKTANAFSKTEEDVINETVEKAYEVGKDRMYDINDIVLSDDMSVLAIKNYANAMALAILNNDTEAENELDSLRKIMNSATDGESTDQYTDEIKKVAEIYKNTLEESLAIPTPKTMTKTHLDIINVYNALYNDLSAMSKIMEDPLLTLIRLKRYEDDKMGLKLAMENLYQQLKPYGNEFTADDPAVMFSVFSPDFNIQNIQ